MIEPGHDTQEPTSARDQLRDEGFIADFRLGDGATIACPGCQRDNEPEQFLLEQLARYEGVSDPGDEQTDLGLACSVCGTHGVLTTAYGPNATAAEGEIMRRMVDVRSTN